MNRIRLVPIGGPDPTLLESLRPALQEEFGALCDILKTSFDPSPSLHAERGQCYSTEILCRMKNDLAKEPGQLLGVTPLDLYIPILTFVFGEAQVNGRCAIVSTHRLRQEFYGLPPDPKLFEDRLIKEAVHELGHALGLTHCDDYLCAMAASHSVEAIDLKSRNLCAACRVRYIGAPSRSTGNQ